MSGEGQLGVRERGCTRGRWSWNGMHKAPVLEFNDSLDSALRCRVWILRGAVWSQALDSVILVGPFPIPV